MFNRASSPSFVVVLVVLAALAFAAGPQAQTAGVSASEAISRALVARMGDVQVAVSAVDVTGDAPIFREAIPDPAAILSKKPIRFTLLTVAGARVPTVATIVVTAPHVRAKGVVARGAIVTPSDIETVTGEVAGVPIKRLPAAAQMIGARVLRPLEPGAIVLASSVVLRRVVEPGDEVTVTAGSGAVQVSATFKAADGGQIGDVIRVHNPETRRFLRGRIVAAGHVEVLNER